MTSMAGTTETTGTQGYAGSRESARWAWARRLFAAVDGGDAEALVAFLTEDVRFTFGNQPTIVGRAAVRAFSSAPSPFVRTRHTVVGVWERDGVVIVELSIEFVLHDGRAMTLPGATIYRLAGDLIRDYRIFTDLSPLFA